MNEAVDHKTMIVMGHDNPDVYKQTRARAVMHVLKFVDEHIVRTSATGQFMVLTIGGDHE